MEGLLANQDFADKLAIFIGKDNGLGKDVTEDLNNIIQPGTYNINTVLNTGVSNSPVTYGILRVGTSNKGQWIYQVIYSVNSLSVHCRTRNSSSVWTTWKQIDRV